MTTTNTKFLQQQRLHEKTVREFVEQQGGVFLALSDDSVFVNNLRGAAYKHLALRAGAVRSFSGREHLIRELKEVIKNRNKPLIFVERETDSVSNADFIKFLRANIPDIFILVLTTEIAKEHLILFLEMGANSCITKPISIDQLVEKIAFTVKPPTQLVALIERGKKLMFLKEYEKALKIATKVLEVKPNSPAGLMLKGDSLKALGKRKDALVAYRQASDMAEMYLEPLKKLADYYNEEGDDQRELVYLDQLDQLSPLNIDRKMSIGRINANLGNFEKAEEVFDQVVRLTNRDAKTRVASVSKNIGEYLTQKNAKLAEKYLTHSLRTKRNMISKSDMETFNTLGIALRNQGKWQEAVKNYMSALTIAPNEANLHYNMSLAYTDGEDFAHAAEHMDEATRLDPTLGEDNDIVSYNIGYAFLRVKQVQKSGKYLTMALKLNPQNEDAQGALAKLRVLATEMAAAAKAAAAQKAQQG
ncbi:tetratricopeptide repeat protein [Desulfocurvibacter africanus]|uniref:Response regulator receiver n=1 Tax=Desulfocurvibacter africanus subsp. africanus str. Walvis Bay TaxID=690850 RepID=F3YXB3_DESAF|nr:tetratricopeptide repeat protein [Desulfocurvibacter africanus]EGJ50611.1 response regulator receiver [Desulfocurvibacter africanus subsp. africanus str. Walvis Bay]